MNFLSSISFIVLLLRCSAAANNGLETECSISPKMDMQIILDSSLSVGKEDFHRMTEAIADSLISRLDVGPNKARVSVFKFSSPSVMVEEFRLTEFTSKSSVQEAIKNIEFIGGATFTGNAMEKSLAFYKEDEKRDDDTIKVCLVFTDGDPSTRQQKLKVKEETEKWAADGVSVFAVGVGHQIDVEALIGIAGDEARILVAENFREIGEVAELLFERICVQVVPVDIHFGQASATSFLAGHEPQNAFVKQTPGHLPWANINTQAMPQTVWYQFADAMRLARFALSSRIDCCLEQAPREFYFMGSDDCTTWEDLLHVTFQFTKYNEEHVWNLPWAKQKKFKCFGIKVVKVSSGVYTSIENVKFWKVKGEETTEDIVPVDMTTGYSSANSFLANHGPENAFAKQIAGHLPWANLNTHQFPQTVWHEVPEEITVARFSISSRTDCCLEQAPREFYFMGSNDCKNWKILLHVTDQFAKYNEEHVYDLPLSERKNYKCFGIKVMKVSSGVYAAIQNVKLWKLNEGSDPHHLVLVDSTADHSSASSYLARHEPRHAFEKQISGHLPWANLNTAKFPHTVWYELSHPTKVVKFALSSRIDCCMEQAPREFYFVGSNDCANWENLLHVTVQFTTYNEEHVWILPLSKRKSYKCFGIKVVRVTSGVYTAIQNIKLWKV